MAKRLVVCADGTWNIPDQKDRGQVRPTNANKLYRALAERDGQGIEQVLYYDPGIGTGRWDRLRGGAVGFGMSAHSLGIYRFLVDNYEPGDDIYLFGFSRGAFTVRSVGGLIWNSGILRPEHRDKAEEAYRLYRQRDEAARPQGVDAQRFRELYAHPERRIRCIGVWDTVGALGIPAIPWLPVTIGFINRRWAFHNTNLNPEVKAAYQALAIDERRPQFVPTLWTQTAEGRAKGQVLEQVWFAGVHSNVGGGYQNSGLSDLAFLWMMDKAKECELAFKQDLGGVTLAPAHLGELRNSRTGLFRLLGSRARPIDQQPSDWPSDREWVTNQSVHPSAMRRLAEGQSPAYAAPNLADYLQRRGAQVARATDRS